MMKRVVTAAVALAMSASFLSAQTNSCPNGAPLTQAQITQDACQKAVDLFQYLAPQLGGAITGGNATLGQGGALGGIGHFSVGVRINAVKGSLPEVDAANVQPVFTGARSSSFNTSTTVVPIPTADAALGIFRGFPVGLTNVGGIDVLVSASYIPNVDVDGVSVETDNPLRLGYGVRVSALQESIISPGVSVTFLKRSLPKVTITGNAGASDLQVQDFEDNTTAWRIIASKSLVMFGIALGYGQDKYDASATARATAMGLTSQSIGISQSMTRSNMFADLSLNLPSLKIVAEIGQVRGGDAPATLNTFQGTGIVDARLYGSLGIRVSR